MCIDKQRLFGFNPAKLVIQPQTDQIEGRLRLHDALPVVHLCRFDLKFIRRHHHSLLVIQRLGIQDHRLFTGNPLLKVTVAIKHGLRVQRQLTTALQQAVIVVQPRHGQRCVFFSQDLPLLVSYILPDQSQVATAANVTGLITESAHRQVYRALTEHPTGKMCIPVI
ncbi:hypothetical protein Xmau_03352 [Xenorhabdus mauleonii]|uniref:Uncharacterized protein n=1 Tax=Xenorhabdus mauleonii TaxID=351675 RepID=A0A2G0NV58_9GAMM|nr:hypothetical protein Xmau_03352 [Xenorhabdus mauleonii]